MFEEDLRARLASAADTVDWGDRPQTSSLPAITLDDIDDRREQNMKGFQALQSRQVQVDVWSNDKLEARDLRETVISALTPAGVSGATRFGRSFIDRRASSFERLDDGSIVYRERIDLTVWYAAA